MKHNQPYLEKYAGRKSRHECPACHDKFSFAYYIDGNTGNIIDKSVGRCNHESGCGYHYTPKEYFKDHPEQPQDYRKGERKISHQSGDNNGKITVRVNTTKEPDKIPKQYIIQSLGYDSNFVVFLCSIFDRISLDSPTIVRLMKDYCLGCTKDKGIIFWQIDINNRVRTGKQMQYNPTTGKRIKDESGAIDWVHAKLKREGILSEDYNLVQCLFGEHLLRRYPDRIVALVESEKSALIAAGVYPDYIWIATGGKSQLSLDKLQVLKGRTVIMFPDADGYSLWCEKSKEIESIGCKVIVSDLLEKAATEADKEAKIDIADWLIRQLQKAITNTPIISTHTFAREEQILQQLGEINPEIHAFIDDLGLVVKTSGGTRQIKKTA